MAISNENFYIDIIAQDIFWRAPSLRWGDKVHTGWQWLLWHQESGRQVDSHFCWKGRSDHSTSWHLPPFHFGWKSKCCSVDYAVVFMIFVMSAFCDLFIGINLSQSMELSSSQIATGQLTYSLEKALCTAPFRIFGILMQHLFEVSTY